MLNAKTFVAGSLAILLLGVSAAIGFAGAQTDGAVLIAAFLGLLAVILGGLWLWEDTHDWGEVAKIVGFGWSWVVGLGAGFWFGGGL